MASKEDDELVPSTTQGFKLGEKKTVEEYAKLDQNDDSLRRWKESLGIGAGDLVSDPNDKRTVIIRSLALVVDGRDDIVIDLTAPGAVDRLKTMPFTIKEGASFTMKVRFTVQHQVLSGLKYLQVVKRKGLAIPLAKDEEMIGSYPPSTTSNPVYEKKLITGEAPTGMMGRGVYSAASKFIDDDGVTHLKFDWSFEVKKDW